MLCKQHYFEMNCIFIYLTTSLILFMVDSSPIVNSPYGPIRGRHVTPKNEIDRSFYAYQEIPYASPPIGSLRFMPPVQFNSTWSEIRNCTETTKICYQADSGLGVKMSEDCLYVNVYTPVDPSSNASLPVLFFIHGGKFEKGSSIYEQLGPGFFMNKDMVVVTVSYRLGAFGFLSTEDSVIYGNQGLEDVNMALKWIQENIYLFGGNPKQVTIDGVSAGAALVGMLVLSEQSKGLFRGAILESGTSICSWAYTKYAKEIAYQLATAIDPTFTTENSPKELLTLLQSASAEEIVNAKLPGLGQGVKMGLPNTWGPVIEEKHEGAFITNMMEEAFENGEFNRVPLLIGVNSEELIAKANDLAGFKKTMAKYDKNITLIVKDDFKVNAKDLDDFAIELRNIYTNGSQFQDNLGASIKFQSDLRYTTSVARHAVLQSKYADVFFYLFSYKGEKLNYNTPDVEGADNVKHDENMLFLWQYKDINDDLTDFPVKDVEIKDKMINIYYNFVTYQNPTPPECELSRAFVWPKVSEDNFGYVDINEDLVIKKDPKEYKAWKNAIDTYGHHPFYTY